MAARFLKLVQLQRAAFSTSRATGDTIGFIGLGQMGSRMAANLDKAGHQLVLNDANRSFANKLASEFKNASVVNNPAEVAEQATTIVTMLPAGPEVRTVYAEILAVAKPGALLLDASTVDVDTAVAVGEQATALDMDWLDCPVSGGVGGAAAGTLTFMVGGTPAGFARAQPVLACMGKNLVHCGASGTGQAAKVCNNMLLAIGMIGTAEAMSMGQKLGMDPKVLANIINTSSGRCWSSDTYNPCPGVMEGVPASNDYQGGFSVDLMAKDLRLAMAASHKSESTVYLGALASLLYERLRTQGYGTKDFSSVFQFLQETDTTWLDSGKTTGESK